MMGDDGDYAYDIATTMIVAMVMVTDNIII